jgi:hypothetical protein
MSQEIKAGLRVRVVIEDRVQGYEPGDRGTVTNGPRTFQDSEPYYLVTMDKDEGGEVAVFNPDEIEPDA